MVLNYLLAGWYVLFALISIFYLVDGKFSTIACFFVC